MSEYKLNPPTVSSYTENMMLKILFEHKGFSEVFRESSWRSDEIASAFGLPEELENDKNLRTVARRLLKARYKTLQKSTALLPELWKQAYENLATLAEFLQLNPVEQELLRFAMHLRSEGPMQDLFKCLPKSDLQRTAAIMADLLKQSKNEILSALKKGSKLDAYGLIDRNYRLDGVQDYLAWGETLDFDEFVTQPLNEYALLKSCTEIPQVPSLQLDDFAHIASMKEMMLTYLQQALKHHQKGVNLLIYGVPGTGKTEFAGLLAQALGISAYNITYMDSDGDVVKAEQRLNYDAQHAPGPETSGTAFFTYGLQWGINNGFLDSAHYQPVVEKAWKYLSTVALQPDGKIGYVQPIGEKAIPGQVVDANSTSNFGVGAFLLAACERVRYLESLIQH